MKRVVVLPFLLGLLFFSTSGIEEVITSSNADKVSLVDYVNPLMATDSKFSLSNGNNYPAIATPWSMNFWTPMTSPMGDGWTYNYNENKIRGIKQTHQPSPWINENAARTLEYAYADFTIAKMAEKMGEEQIAEKYFEQSMNYKNLLDPSTNLMREKNAFVGQLDQVFEMPPDYDDSYYGFTIALENNSESHVYIQSTLLNGKSYPNSCIRYEDIQDGGEFVFHLDEIPNKNWGSKAENIPYSYSREK